MGEENILAYVTNTNLKFYSNMEYTLKESTIYKIEKMPLTFYEKMAYFVLYIYYFSIGTKYFPSNLEKYMNNDVCWKHTNKSS